MYKKTNVIIPNENSALELINNILGNFSLSYSIRGGSYMGKTFLLKSLYQNFEKSNDSNKIVFIPVLVELNSLNFDSIQNLNSILIRKTLEKIAILSKIKIANNNNYDRINPLEFIINKIRNLKEENNIFHDLFYHIVWILDDLNKLNNYQWRDVFLSHLRSNIDNHSQNFNLIISFKTPDDLIGDSAGSKLFYVLETKILQNLSLTQQKKHIEMKYSSLKITNEINNQILEITGGNIFLINKYLNCVLQFEKRIFLIEHKKLIQFLDYLYNDLKNFFNKLNKELSDSQREILMKMINKPYLEPFDEIWIKNQLSTIEEHLSLRENISALISKGIINSSDNQYIIAGDLMRKGFSFLLN